jgi:thioester reductase-like protein
VAERVYLFTGVPGFIASRLLRALLAVDNEVRAVALVEAGMRQRALEWAAGVDAQRIEVLTGDIADRRLGLADADYDRLVGQTTEVFHLAAIYDLAVPLETAQRVNVDGTGNVLDLCAAAPGLTRLHYVSTAYVAGLRRGVVYEHELSLGQSFKNHYESTKFQAELWVREMLDRVPTTIYRPAIVVGDSRTGETQKFDGPYFLLRLIARAVRQGLPIVQTGRSGAAFNVVPVDFVVDAITAVAGQGTGVGDTLHLVDPEPLSAAELTGELSRAYAGREPKLRVPARLIQESLRSPSVRKMFSGTPRESVRYLNHPVRFDTRVADRVLGSLGIQCPRFPEYVQTMVDFFRAHEQTL